MIASFPTSERGLPWTPCFGSIYTGCVMIYHGPNTINNNWDFSMVGDGDLRGQATCGYWRGNLCSLYV